MSKKPAGLADTLRQEIERRGVTAYRIGKETGISQVTLRRFIREENDLTLANIEALLNYLNWTVGPAPNRKAKP